jgi:hypothetical protein
MRGTIRSCVILLLAAGGCGFSDWTEGDGPLDPTEPITEEPPPEEPTVIERRCSASMTDSTLRLCLDFEDPDPFDKAYDGTMPYNDAEMVAVTPMTRTPQDQPLERAAELSTTSELKIAESAELDIPDAITIGMWIRPSSAPEVDVALLDNDRQYSLTLRADRRTSCAILGDSEPGKDPVTADGSTWTHVACRYDGDEMRIYVNGSVSECRRFDKAIATDSMVGTAIGADLDATGQLGTRFVGGLDNVRVYARALSNSDLCAAAGRTDCETQCPRRENSGPGGGNDGDGDGGDD